MPKGIQGRPTCNVDGCADVNDARGMCRKHYQRWAKHGDTSIGLRTRDEQFSASYVVNSDGCWEWTAALVTNGYAAFWDNGRAITGHRWSYERHIGPIPPGLQIDHLCRNRACVNPDHLEAVTLAENVLRGAGLSAKNARKTHCKRGHEFTPANTYIGTKGERTCRACKAQWAREKAHALAAS